MRKEHLEQAGKIIINVSVFLTLITLCFYTIKGIICLWPPSDTPKIPLIIFGTHIDWEKRYFLLVTLAGALGSFVHVATSFTDFLGNKNLVYSWIPWYLMRPFIGAALAVIFYMLLRGGLISYQAGAAPTAGGGKPETKIVQTIPANTDTVTAVRRIAAKDSSRTDTATPVMAPPKTGNESPADNAKDVPLPFNPFGIVAVACLVGLSSQKASDKLNQLFKTFFGIKDDAPEPVRKDRLDEPEKSTKGNII